MMYGYGLGSGYGFMGGFFMLIFWVLIIWLIVALVRGGGHLGRGCCGGHGSDSQEDQALKVLRERYAKGDITKEEFEEKSQVLKK
jgi:putative membrane protein